MGPKKELILWLPFGLRDSLRFPDLDAINQVDLNAVLSGCSAAKLLSHDLVLVHSATRDEYLTWIHCYMVYDFLYSLASHSVIFT